MSDLLALDLRGITKKFAAFTALDAVSLTVRPGTVHALLGENGAGKTTLMRVAYGLTSPDEGTIVVNGSAATLRSPAAAIAAGIGMVQQHPSNVAGMTVWENVMLGGAGRVAPSEAREEVRALATQVGFALEPNARVTDLSVGAQQRLEILKAVRRNAQVLILDEPTAILPPEEAASLYSWLRGFAARGGAVVVITHRLEDAIRFTDDLTVLRAGKVIVTARSATKSASELAMAMIGESLAEPTVSMPAPSARQSVLRAESVTLVGARGVPAIRDATFEVRSGEILGIAGVEGSGHHELLLALADRHSIASGTITRTPRVAFVPEDRHRDASVLEFSLAENVAIKGIGARRGRMAWRAMAHRVMGLLSAYDVRARGSNEKLAMLSGGNQQKLILARELDDNPDLIVVENPTRGLDVRAAAFVRDRLRKAREGGAGVVMYSSDLDEIIGIADRVIVVHAGVIRETARDRAAVGAAMLGAA